MTVQTNVVTEVAPGVFHATLAYVEASAFAHLVTRAPLVLCWNHRVGNYSWTPFTLPIIRSDELLAVESRIVTFDFIVETRVFLELLPRMGRAIQAVQLERRPPAYLDMARIRGRELYRILGDCGWSVLLETTGTDFGTVLSPHRHIVERAVHLALGQQP